MAKEQCTLALVAPPYPTVSPSLPAALGAIPPEQAGKGNSSAATAATRPQLLSSLTLAPRVAVVAIGRFPFPASWDSTESCRWARICWGAASGEMGCDLIWGYGHKGHSRPDVNEGAAFPPPPKSATPHPSFQLPPPPPLQLSNYPQPLGQQAGKGKPATSTSTTTASLSLESSHSLQATVVTGRFPFLAYSSRILLVAACEP